MIKLFGQTDTSFSSNGDIVLRPLKAKVHKEDNGDYYLDLETSLDYVDYLVEGNIIVANTPQGDQAYPMGAKVSHNNKHWVSDIDNNVYEPSVYGWAEVDNTAINV